MSLGIVHSKEPAYGPVKLGKLVRDRNGEGVYAFDNVTPFRRIMAFGVAIAVLATMIQQGYRHLYYFWEGDTYTATVDQLLRYGEEGPPGSRPGYRYLRLRHWQRQAGRVRTEWVGDNRIIELPWMTVYPPSLANTIKQLQQAQAPAAVQMALF